MRVWSPRTWVAAAQPDSTHSRFSPNEAQPSTAPSAVVPLSWSASEGSSNLRWTSDTMLPSPWLRSLNDFSARAVP